MFSLAGGLGDARRRSVHMVGAATATGNRAHEAVLSVEMNLLKWGWPVGEPLGAFAGCPETARVRPPHLPAGHHYSGGTRLLESAGDRRGPLRPRADLEDVVRRVADVSSP